jgi:hypothetical protein
MITFAFDRKGPHGFVPNLVTRTDIVPDSDDWWDLCITAPFSYEFRLLQYMEIDGVPYNTVLVSDIVADTGPVTYPINLNFFDPEIDYIGLISNAAQELCRKGMLKILFYYSEGDNPKSHIENNLHAMCDTHKIPMENIRFVIANRSVNGKGPFIYFPDHELNYRHMHIQEKNYIKQVNVQQRSKIYTCRTRVDKSFRKVFASSLWYHGLTDNGYFSYLGITAQQESKENRKDPVLKWNNHWHNLDQLFSNFDMHSPFLTNEVDDKVHSSHKVINHRFYDDAYFNFVIEPHFSKNNVLLTEKTFKPILNMQPFVIVGAPGSLKLLRELGYETFGDWVDEGYDNVRKDEDRMFDVFATAYEINGMSHEDLVTMTKEMIPVLAHNQQVLLNSKRAPLEKLINQIK